MKNIMKIVPVVAILAMVLMPVTALALVNPSPPLSGDPVTLRTIEDIINRIAQFLIVFGVILAVIFIIWGGISWMAAGGDDDKVKTARSRITNGIIGAAIVLGVGVILQTLSSLISRNFFQ